MLRNRRDQARLDYLQARAAEYRARADQAANPRERADLLTAARRFDRMYRTERTFPIGIWLFWARIILVMLPWGLLAGAHHPVLGLVLSGVVLVVLVAFAVRKRRRRTTEPK